MVENPRLAFWWRDGCQQSWRGLFLGESLPAKKIACIAIKNGRNLFILLFSPKVSIFCFANRRSFRDTRLIQVICLCLSGTPGDVHQTILRANWISLPGVVVSVSTPAVPSGAPVESKMSVWLRAIDGTAKFG
jgi:hypothetical protein